MKLIFIASLILTTIDGAQLVKIMAMAAER